MNKVLFSVIVPIFNIQEYLEQCINSLLSQTFENFEILLIDDGSTDNCANICDKYALIDKRIKVIHKKNEGLAFARKTGIENSIGEYIIYVDGDDWVDFKLLEKLNEIIKKSQPDIINFNAFKSINDKNIVLKTSNFTGEFDKKKIDEIIVPRMLYDSERKFFTFGILPAVWCKAFKVEILRKNFCKDKRITFGEDAACTYNCIIDAKKIFFIDDCLYYYRQNRQSMTKAYDKKRFERINILFKYLDNNLIDNNGNVSKQLEYYKLFCIYYAFLNEAKDNEKSIKSISQKCNEEMTRYNLNIYLNDELLKSQNFPWNIFGLLIKKKKYFIIICICKIIMMIKYKF